jgi:lysozyme
VRAATLAVIAASAAFLLLRSKPAQAMTDYDAQDTSDVPRESDINPEVTPPLEIPFDYEWNPGYGTEVELMDARIKAFLYMIRSTEHVYPRDVENNACYHIFYGGSTFRDFSDHPVITKEKKGIPLPDAMCAAAGLRPGCVSTAAGAYQFIKPTWERIREIAPRLPDFSPQSQDWAAIRLLNEIGALRLITAGDIPGAIAKASSTWASLPGSTAQQNPKRLAYAMDRFNEGLIYG